MDLGPGKLYATSAGNQVGEGPHFNAVLWNAGGIVDLQPGGFYASRVSGISNGEQVGYGGPSGQGHALLWRGDVNNMVDLHAFLPPGFAHSYATGIDANGDIVGVAEGPASDFRSHAFLWTRNANATPAPVPPIDKFSAFENRGVTLRTLLVVAGYDVEVTVIDPVGYQSHPQRSMNHWELSIPNQMSGQYTLDVIGKASGLFSVQVSISNEAGHYSMHLFDGIAAPGRISRFTFPGEFIAFAAFGAHVKINSVTRSFEVTGSFTLGPGGGISPATQPVTLALRRIWTIPAGSFRETGRGTFVFEGTIPEGVALKATVTRTGDKSYSFMIAGTGTADLPDANPVEVLLSIGSTGGSTDVNADFPPRP